MDDIQKVRLALDAAIRVLDDRKGNCTPAEVEQLKIENEQLKQKLDAEWMAGVQYAIYEIMKECDVPGSNEIRESGDSDDGMCAQAAEKICRTSLEQQATEIEQLKRERDAAISDLRICCGCEACKFRFKPDCLHKMCINHNYSNWQWRGPKEG